MSQIQIKDLDIYQIFEEVIALNAPLPNAYPLEFDIDSIKDVFEFLLQFVSMLCKHFYGNFANQVDLSILNENDFRKINTYLLCIGFTCNFQELPVNNHNINYAFDNRYDRIAIMPYTQLKDLLFGIKCNETLYIISFDIII